MASFHGLLLTLCTVVIQVHFVSPPECTIGHSVNAPQACSQFVEQFHTQVGIVVLTKTLSLTGDLYKKPSSTTLGMSEYPPRLVEEPMDLVVGRHQPATLECRAEGDPSPSIRWYKDGVLLTQGGAGAARRVLLPAGGLFFLRATHARRDTDQGVYWCEASNHLGTVRSRNATLQVAVLREDFRLEPADTRGAAGDSALLECSPPRGTPEPTVIWRKNGQDLDLEDNDRISIVDGGNLVIQDLRTNDDGRYQCVAKNIVATRESAVARLRVHIKPYLIAGPEDITVLTGKTVTFECRVGGDPLPDVLWRRTADGGNMPLGRVHILEDRSLQLDSVTIEDQGDYICEADNTVGTIKAWGTLTVHSMPSSEIKPSIQTVEEGNDANFECNVKGTPKPSIFWSMEGNHTILFSGNSWERFNATSTKDGESKLVLKNVTKADSSIVVVCTAVNLAGSVVKRTRLIVTSDDSKPPPIILIGPSNQTLPIKTLAVMPCSAEGDPSPIISWYYKSTPVVPNKKYEISETGTLTVKDLTGEDSGQYTCVASSKNGKSVSSGSLQVESPTNPNINFFRGPDTSSLPGAPTRPQIRNQTENSVTITWTQNNKIGSSSMLGYQVEMFGRDNVGGGGGKLESKWVVVARRLQETVFTQKQLVPGGTYVFLIRAENSHGVSPPSSLSETVIVEEDESNYVSKSIDDLGLSPKVRGIFMTEDIVQLLDTIAVESTAVKLVWKASNTVNLDGFNIYFRPLDGFNISSTDYKMVSLLNSRGTTSYEISGLLKFTQYEFFLIPFYRKLEGKPSNSRLVRTLEDVPNASPTDLEGAYINSTSIILKWKPPPPGTHNGVIQCYQIVVKEAGNDSHVVQNMSVVGNSVRVNNLSPGVTYWIQLAAATMRGIGPYSHHGTLHLPPAHGFDPSTRLLDQPHNRNNLHHDIQTVVSGDLLGETWFLVVLGLILTIMTLLFTAMIFIRRRHLLMKENPLPNLYDSRNGSKNFVSHMSIKSAMGLQNPISTGFKQNGNIKTDSLLWVKNRPDTWRRGEKGEEFGQVPLPEYDKINGNMPDYAEVDASMITFRKGSETPNSPAAYASVTLVPSPGNPKGSMEWTNRYGSNNSTNKNEEHDEEIYPASNGGYFNRNLFTETYLSHQNQNISKYHNGVRNNDKSNLSLHSEKYINSNKMINPNNDQTFTLPQNHFGTGRRNQRPMKLSKFEKGMVDNDCLQRNETYQSSNMRMQENPTFGLMDGKYETGYSPECEQMCHPSVPPMLLMNHQYPRPANIRTSPNDARGFASFKNKNRDTEYHTSTRSEPGNDL